MLPYPGLQNLRQTFTITIFFNTGKKGRVEEALHHRPQ